MATEVFLLATPYIERNQQIVIRFNCPQCRQTLKCSESKQGTVSQCPKCQERVEVPVQVDDLQEVDELEVIEPEGVINEGNELQQPIELETSRSVSSDAAPTVAPPDDDYQLAN